MLGKGNVPSVVKEWVLDVSDGRPGLFFSTIRTLVAQGILRADVSNLSLRPEILDYTMPSEIHQRVFGRIAADRLDKYGAPYEALLLGVPLTHSDLVHLQNHGSELELSLNSLVEDGQASAKTEGAETVYSLIRSAASHVARWQVDSARRRELQHLVSEVLMRRSRSAESLIHAAILLSQTEGNGDRLSVLKHGARALLEAGEPGSCAACLETALRPRGADCTGSNSEIETELLEILARAYEMSGRLGESLGLWKQIRRKCASNGGNKEKEANSSFQEARIRCVTGETESAMEALAHAENIVVSSHRTEFADELIEAIKLYGAVCQWRQGELGQCLDKVETAMGEKVKSKVTQARLLNLRGICFQHLGQFESAMAELVRAEALAEKLTDSLTLLMIKVNQGVVELVQGNLENASSELQAVARAARGVSNASVEALAAFNLAEITAMRGQLGSAWALLDYATSESKRTGDDLGLDCILSLHGQMLELAGKASLSLVVLRECVARLQSRGSFVDFCLALIRLSVAESKTGRARRGLERAIEACEMARKSGARLLEGCALRAIGIAHSHLDEHDQAEASFGNSAQILGEIRAPYELGRTLHARALNLIKAGSKSDAQTHLDEAAALFRKVGAKLDLRRSREALILCTDGELPYETDLPSDKERLKTLYQLGQVLETAKTIEELIDRILQLAIDCVGGRNSALVLTTESGRSLLRVFGGDNICRTMAAAVLSSDLMLGIEKRKCVSSNAPSEEPLLKAMVPEDSPVEAFLMAPLSVPGSMVGWLYLDYRDPVSKFSEEDTTAALSFARQAALVFENCEFSDKLKSENEFLRWQMFEKYSFSNIIGCSSKMLELFDLLEKISDSDASVLITGESGTGKELIARAIHYNSRRRNERFVAQNCAALPKELLESELFGHIKGSFTSAGKDKVGLFELAHNGTFFLDEIADLDAGLQAKLLRVIEEGEIRRVGDVENRQIDVRLLSATNRDIMAEIDAGRFREDLYYRLNVISVDVPPLRDRREDIPVLAHYFLNRLTSPSGKKVLGFTDAAMGALTNYEWPGNVRQLRNEIHRAFTLASDGSPVTTSILSMDIQLSAGVPIGADTAGMTGLKEMLDSIERSTIKRTLDENGWNKSKAAQTLGISRQGLLKKIARYGLEES
jgi:Nif-specific regulatory protein